MKFILSFFAILIVFCSCRDQPGENRQVKSLSDSVKLTGHISHEKYDRVPINITIDKDEKIYFRNKKVNNINELEQLIITGVDSTKNILVLKMDRDVRVGIMKDVLEMAYKHGVKVIIKKSGRIE